MKIARSKRELVLGILALLVLACVMMVSTDERMSRQLDGVRVTWDELDPKPQIGGPAQMAKGHGRVPAP